MLHLLLLWLADVSAITVPDWVVHFVALILMGLLTGYVKMLVKGVMLEMKHNKAIVDATIAPIKSNVSWLKRMTNWSSESLTTLSIKSGIDIPKKPE